MSRYKMNLSLGRMVLAVTTAGAAVFLLPVSSQAESYQQALIAAYESNPEIRASRAAVRVADEGVAKAMSGWRPNLSGNLNYGVEHSERTTSGSQDLTPHSASLQLTQNLYEGGRTVNAVKQAKSVILLRREELRRVEQQILLNSATAYLDVLQARARLELTRNNEKVLGRQLEAAKDRFEVGEVTRTDVAQASARLSRAIANRAASEGDLAQARARYKRIVGKDAGALEAAPALPELPATVEEAISISLENNPNILISQLSEEASRIAIDLAEGALYPTLNLVGTVSRAYDVSVKNFDTESESLTAQLAVPIYQRGQVSAQVREAKEIRNQRRIEVENARRGVAEETAQAFEGLVARRQEIRSRMEQVRANEIALEGVTQEAAVGSRTTLDVLDAEQELLEARVSLVVAERDEYVAGIRLLAAMGQFGAQDLNLAAAYYDPEVHANEVEKKYWGTEISAE